MLYSELMALSVNDLKKEIERRGEELDIVIDDLQALPLNGSPGEMAAARRLTAEAQDGQALATKMARRLLEIDPPPKPVPVFTEVQVFE